MSNVWTQHVAAEAVQEAKQGLENRGLRAEQKENPQLSPRLDHPLCLSTSKTNAHLAGKAQSFIIGNIGNSLFPINTCLS